MAAIEDSTVEVWKPVPEFDGVVEASSLGRVRRAIGNRRVPSGFVYKPVYNRGYERLAIWFRGRYYHRHVHSLVAEAFIGIRPAAAQVNHIDGIKSNNIPSNLEYCTAKENTDHSVKLGLKPAGANHYLHKNPARARRGSNHAGAKLTEDQARSIRFFPGHLSREGMRAIAMNLGIGWGTVKSIRCGRHWKHLTPP